MKSLTQIKFTIITVICIAAFVALNCLSNRTIHKALINPILHPGYGACFRCGRTWDVVHWHDTPFGDCVWIVTTQKGTNLPFRVEGAPNDGKEHEVTVADGDGCFPLCEQCWQSLTPKQRLPYYRELLDEWEKEGDKTEAVWPRMKAAVLEGK